MYGLSGHRQRESFSEEIECQSDLNQMQTEKDLGGCFGTCLFLMQKCLMMIAGHAKSLGYTIVTNNTKEFNRVLGVNYSPPSRCTRLEEGASIRRSLVSRLRGVKFIGRFLNVQTLQTILCSELTPAFQPVLCKVILYSQYILSECCV